jgi:CDP-glycerol glycerophosphotransferase
MPVYNVESYLSEAVESVLSQDYRNLELILVDDGSSDSSGQMCDKIATQDARVRVIHQPNAGLGAARNSGIAVARGKYLAFVDSDDYLLPKAYSQMIGALSTSGSDIVTGNVMRRDGKRVYQSWLQSRSHLADKSRLTLAESPELLFDTVAWNKVYRTAFWRTYVKGFPVKKLYEDTATVFTALLHAKTIDVITAPVYVWRQRDEGGSITQRLLEPENITDRFEMIDRVDAMIRDNGLEDALGDQLSTKILEVDLWVYVRDMVGAPPETIDRIQQVAKHYWPATSARVKSLIPVERRVCYWLLEQERGTEVPDFLMWYASVASAPPLRRESGMLLLDISDSPVPVHDAPADTLEMSNSVEAVANITAVRWTGPTTLTVEGYGYTRFVSDGSQDISLVGTNLSTGETVTTPAARTASADSARWTSDLTSAHDHDGFSAAIDVELLRSSSTSDPRDSEWSFVVRVEDGEISRTIELPKIWKLGSGAVVGASVLPDQTLAIVKTDLGGPLRIRFDGSSVLATSFEVHRTAAVIRLNEPAAGVTRLWFAGSGAERTVEATRGTDGSFTARFPTTTQADQTTTWRALALVGGDETPVLAPAGFSPALTPNPDGFRPVVSRTGQAIVNRHPGSAIVGEITFSQGEIEVAGALFALDDLEVGIAPRAGVPRSWHHAEVHDGLFRVSVPTARAGADGIQRPLQSGNYLLHARPRSAPDAIAEILLNDATAVELPTTYLSDDIKIRFVRRDVGRVGVEIGAPVPDELLGQYAQAQLTAKYGTSPRQLEDAVFFYVDLGSAAADSALAIHQELRERGLPLTLYWGVEDLSVPVPPGGVPIVKRSELWYAKANRSRYIVNNYGGLWGLSKDPGQRYLQTWHGTPLKVIGVTEARNKGASRARFEQIAREGADWDAFTSPSPYFSELIPSEFCFTGEVLETSYPRNDRLSTTSAAEREAIRARFGITSSMKVLLYAPTFREGQRDGWRADLYDGLDVARLASLLGPDWRILLRGHSFTARDDHADRSVAQVIDVTRHPDVNDLYLAADVLVTDYSSVMFDFVITGRPMAFFTPDLKQYIAVRGVYFDLSDWAPGPMYDDVEHLAAGLADLDKLAAEYADRYEAFRERFAPWDDGKAASRVVDAFFGDAIQPKG